MSVERSLIWQTVVKLVVVDIEAQFFFPQLRGENCKIR
jgi:hypothetical protein